MTTFPLRSWLGGLVAFLGGITAAPAASLLINGSFEEGSADPDSTPAGYMEAGVGDPAITPWAGGRRPWQRTFDAVSPVEVACHARRWHPATRAYEPVTGLLPRRD